ncbi:hypothetical protein SAMN05421874_11095 [Nonomuraea maritima]|uniref:Uncharacterized protein n=1 Tax=Nonomuraea maritima TaxID=683260 RepID=A0A1G9E1X4_9ACTN|nr:hypothetical protein [Nonomuraea maritima]SDK70109.1 hypothetical protein SAMN05421874_11095 [Nonomuraea maritima]
MTDRAVIDELQQAIDEAFAGRDRVAVREVYSHVSEHVRLPADLLGHLNELPEGAYSRPELTEAINDVIRRRGEQDTLGLLQVPRQAESPFEQRNPASMPPEDDNPMR